MKKKNIYLIFVITLLLTGCASLKEIRDEERLEQVTGIDKHSTYPAVRRDAFERVNLLELIDPENQAAERFKDNWAKTIFEANDPYDKKINNMGAKYDLVLAHFRQRKDISEDEKRKLRNSIQERILSVSISRCNVFKTYIRRDQANVNFGLGMATTVAGALGAVLPGADAARFLAGASGLFSGVRAEYNQAYYSNLAANVIAKGIETKQELVYRRIQTEGQSKSIEAYPLEAAIKDAVYFDGLCSVVAGLDQAAASVDATNEPGLDAAMRTVLRARLLKEAADMPREKLLNSEDLKSIKHAGAELGLSLVGTVRGEVADETDLSYSAATMIDQVNLAAALAAQEIEKVTLDQKKVLLEQVKTEEERKKLSGKSPKEGEIVEMVRHSLKSKLLEPLKLDACYYKLAVPAVNQRSNAVVEQGKAKTDAEKAKAGLAIGEAKRAIEKAYEQIQLKGRLIRIEINTYREERLKEIKGVVLKTDETWLSDLKNVAVKPPDSPKASKEPSCE